MNSALPPPAALVGFDGRVAIASSTGTRAVLGAFERAVCIMDLETGGTSPRLETTFDAGGHRLALSDEIDQLVTAAYHRHGVAAYACRSGDEIWRRSDVKQVQRVSLSRDGRTAYCGRDAGPLIGIDLCTGETTRVLKGTRALYESRFDAVDVVDAAKPYLSQSAGSRCAIARVSFAFLDVCFVPGAVVLSEAGGPTRCIEAIGGKERWRYLPAAGRHVLRLGYEASDPSVLGVEWSYASGGAMSLIRWSIETGQVEDTTSVGDAADCCFGLDARMLVLSDGSRLLTRRPAGEPL